MTDHGVSVAKLQTEGLNFSTTAMIEGEASLIEQGLIGKLDQRSARRTMANQTQVQAPRIPLSCRTTSDVAACAFAAAIYTEGAAFASAMYRAGGTALLDAMHTKPPTTTLEISLPGALPPRRARARAVRADVGGRGHR